MQQQEQQQQQQQEQRPEPLKDLSPSHMLLLLGEESERLGRIEQKILKQLHSLQVEEELLMRMLKTNDAKEAPTTRISNEQGGEVMSEDEGTSTMGDLEKVLEEALETTSNDGDCDRSADDGHANQIDDAATR